MIKGVKISGNSMVCSTIINPNNIAIIIPSIIRTLIAESKIICVLSSAGVGLNSPYIFGNKSIEKFVNQIHMVILDNCKIQGIMPATADEICQILSSRSNVMVMELNILNENQIKGLIKWMAPGKTFLKDLKIHGDIEHLHTRLLVEAIKSNPSIISFSFTSSSNVADFKYKQRLCNSVVIENKILQGKTAAEVDEVYNILSSRKLNALKLNIVENSNQISAVTKWLADGHSSSNLHSLKFTGTLKTSDLIGLKDSLIYNVTLTSLDLEHIKDNNANRVSNEIYKIVNNNCKIQGIIYSTSNNIARILKEKFLKESDLVGTNNKFVQVDIKNYDQIRALEKLVSIKYNDQTSKKNPLTIKIDTHDNFEKLQHLESQCSNIKSLSLMINGSYYQNDQTLLPVKIASVAKNLSLPVSIEHRVPVSIKHTVPVAIVAADSEAVISVTDQGFHGSQTFTSDQYSAQNPGMFGPRTFNNTQLIGEAADNSNDHYYNSDDNYNNSDYD